MGSAKGIFKTGMWKTRYLKNTHYQVFYAYYILSKSNIKVIDTGLTIRGSAKRHS